MRQRSALSDPAQQLATVRSQSGASGVMAVPRLPTTGTWAEALAAARRESLNRHERELAELDKFLAAPGPRLCVVTGEAGSGKTQLLRGWLGTHRDVAVSWVADTDPATAETLRLAAEADSSVFVIDGFERFEPIQDWLRHHWLPFLSAATKVVLTSRRRLRADWREDPGWLRLLHEVHLTPPAPATTPHPGPELDEVELHSAIKHALRRYWHEAELEHSPLLALEPIASVKATERVARLRTLLRECCESLGTQGRDGVQRRVLEATYLRGAEKQLGVAALLGMSFSTYRRHLTEGTRRLVRSVALRITHRR